MEVCQAKKNLSALIRAERRCQFFLVYRGVPAVVRYVEGGRYQRQWECPAVVVWDLLVRSEWNYKRRNGERDQNDTVAMQDSGARGSEFDAGRTGVCLKG